MLTRIRAVRSRSRTAFGVCSAVCVSFTSIATAQQAPPPAAPKPLAVGDPAPALNIAHWVKGSPVKSFEKGTAYVVEFWATWCMPCIAGIPKLTALQAEHKGKLVIIGVSSSDRRGVDDVRPFVEKQGDAMNYTVAVDDSFKTGNAYMAATGQGGIPVAYVVDKEGKLAWFGHPANGMSDVVKMVIDGTFDPKSYVDPQRRLEQLQTALAAAANAKDWSKANQIFDDLKELRPDAALQFEVGRFQFTYGTEKNKPKAHALAEQLLAGPANDGPQPLSMMASVVLQDESPSVTDLALAKRVMERAVELTARKDPRSLSILGDVFKKDGDYSRAIALQEEAIKLALDPGTKKSLEMKLDMIKSERDAKQPKP